MNKIPRSFFTPKFKGNKKEIINIMKNKFNNIKESEEKFLEIYNFIINLKNNKMKNYIKRNAKKFVSFKEIKNEQLFNSLNAKNGYDIKKYLFLGYSKTEGEIKIKELKRKTSGNLENFIRKYGREEGIKRYNDFSKKCDTASKKYYIEKFGFEEGIKKYSKRKERHGFTLQKAINKLGKEKGIEKYNKWKELVKQTKENMIKRYGEKEGIKRWEEFLKRKSYANSKENFLKFHTEEEWVELNKSKAITLENMIKRYGEKEGEKRYEEWRIKTIPKSYSKESIEFFNYIHNFLIKNGFSEKDIYWKENEYFIFDKINKKIYLYDFTVPKLNLIIEYHGSMWHFNPNFEYSDDFRQPFSKETLNELKEKDDFKRNLAIQNGFKIIEIFDTDNKQEKQEEILHFIKNLL